MQTSQIITLIAAGLTMFGVIGFLSFWLILHLNGISQDVGDGSTVRRAGHQTGN
jgi:type IV secretion system protein VirD4